MTPTDFMLLAGLIILVGFLADELFRRKYIPDSIVLILLGMALGHFSGLLPPELFLEFAGFMAAIAVAIILYDTGLNLDLITTLKESGQAFVIGTISYFVSAILFSVVAFFMLGWDPIRSLILGAMLGGTSAAVVASVVSKLPISEKTKAILNIESTLTNAYALLFVLTLIDVATRGSADPVGAIQQLVATLSVSVLLGLLGGIFWLRIFSSIRERPYVQVLTLGVMFLLYAVTEYLKGIGAIAAFVFGLVLGNARTVKRMFFLEGDYKVSSLFKSFNDEISFFIRVFFFVFLGIIFVPPQGLLPYLVALLLTSLALIARYIAIVVAKPRDPEIVLISIPRGLSEAVVASLLVAMDFPGALTYLQIASLVILLTNVATAVLIAYVVNSLYKNKKTEPVN